SRIVLLSACAGGHAQCHDQDQQHSDESFHFAVSFFCLKFGLGFIFTPSGGKTFEKNGTSKKGNVGIIWQEGKEFLEAPLFAQLVALTCVIIV
ncbi:MAG: hypothetical protein IJ422_09435, partial [Oscillospiraceae bacterium]|nr:hypothetical protein [Oscillospiraceae bacterium]